MDAHLSKLMLDPRRVPPETFAGLLNIQKILKMLLETRIDSGPHIYIDGGQGNQLIRSGGFRPMHFFNWVASSRDVMLRELRRIHQLPISDPPHVFNDAFYTSNGNRVKYTIPQYRIELTPRQILALDWSRFWERPFDAIFDWDSMLIDSNVERPGIATKPAAPATVYENGDAVTCSDQHHSMYAQPGRIQFIRNDKQYQVNFWIMNESVAMPASKLMASRDFKKDEL